MKPQKIFSLQVYRGIAAIFVLLFHITGFAKDNFGYVFMGNMFAFGYTGVDFFFVLSGFIILFANIGVVGQKDQLKAYLGKRFIRIFPIYWCITSLKIFYIIVSPASAKSYEQNIGVMIKSFFLIPQINLPIIGAAWTLSYELMFYILFGAFVVYGMRRGFSFLIFWGSAIIIYNVALYFRFINLDDNYYLLNFILNERNLEFIFGCASAYFILNHRIKKPVIMALSGLLLVIGASWYVNTGNNVAYYSLIFGLPFFLIITGSAFIEVQSKVKWPAILVFLGDASYSIYLTHALFVNVFAIINNRLDLINRMGPFVVTLMMAIFAISCGSAVYQFVERPILKMLRKKMPFLKGAA